MKLNIKGLLLAITLGVSGLINSQLLMANEGGGQQVIVSIDLAKKLIKFTDITFKFNKNTDVFDLYGQKVDIKLLEKDMLAVPVYNPEQRFVGYPTVKKIYLKTIFN